MLDTKALAEATAAIVRQHVEAATAPLLKRIDALEAAKAYAPDYQAIIAAEVAKIDLPAAPEALAPDMGEIAAMIERAVSDSVKTIPVPKDGVSVTLDDVAPIIEDGIAKAVAALPPAKDGVGVAGAVIDRDNTLCLTLTDGTVRDLGCVVGKDADTGAILDAIEAKFAALPLPRDGVDGFGFEDLQFEHDGERGFTLKFIRGERVKEFPFTVPVVIDRGVWREGAHAKGDFVTWAGSGWIAQKDTDAKPDAADGSWRLAIKKGRDGKDKA